MRLEDEIKQTKPFPNEWQKLMVNIQFTASHFSLLFAQRLKPFGITPQQYNVLRILRGKHPEGYSNLEITQRMLDKSSNATRIVDKLQDKGLIQRIENKDDRRQVIITITDKGLKILKQTEESPIPDELKLYFSEEKAKALNDLLDELRGQS